MVETVTGQFNSRRVVTLVFGVLLGISGINHGLFESLQGSKPTHGLIVQAIGQAQRMWPHGTEEAFTIVPNLLITGLLSVLVGIALIVWSCWFVQIRHGPLVLLLLFITLFLVGGGIAQVLFFLPVWAYSTTIGKPLRLWKRVLNGKIGQGLSYLWEHLLALSSVLFLLALEITIVGFFPGINNQDTILYLCWTFLAISWILMNLSFISSFAHDIGPQNR